MKTIYQLIATGDDSCGQRRKIHSKRIFTSRRRAEHPAVQDAFRELCSDHELYGLDFRSIEIKVVELQLDERD